MKKVAVAIALFLSMQIGQLHAQGIQFEHISFEEALKKAKEQNKLIFIDFYTVWCGPCKAMTKNVFPDPKIGELFNKEFINIKLDAEKEGLQIARKYEVTAYPTLMFINGEGKMAYKKVGGLDIEKTFKMGNSALNSIKSDYSLAKLKELFPNKQNDEDFLKLYMNKMIDYGENPTEGIEAWLKIQTEINENDVDMMEFLMDNSKYLICDGKADEILTANMNEYLDIATRAEEKQLKRMRSSLVNNTRKAAYQDKNPALLRSFITNWKKLPSDENGKYGNLADFELDYLLFTKDYNTYKKQAEAYLDSIVSAKPLTQIRIDDKAIYETYKKEQGGRRSLIGDAILESLEKGKEATMQKSAIEKVGYNYLGQCKSKNDYKRLMAWIDYGTKLVALDNGMDNLKARALYHQGRSKEAIKLRESVLAKISKGDKSYSFLQAELVKMKNGEKL
ncbi:thioredoxin family protein [Flavobacterium granuli]|uniref:Thioredoxin n=1 Tax=Flavobacterium granuli TaxID=280093 RepID=A0A1M5S8D2_9FLAO|nr:thioredoxin family protein [Flavobacterium granuli]PRZ21245.1 thioredoxin [Flavobacterium granuli]SHH34744.1 Thioredoxin [Flavobacterium granuli]